MSKSIAMTSARALQTPDVKRGRLAEKTEMVDQLFPRIPFIPVDGELYQIPRIDIDESLNSYIKRAITWTGTTLQNPALTLDTATTPGGIDTFDPPAPSANVDSFALFRLATQIDLNSWTDEILSKDNPQLQMQIDVRLKAMQYEWSDAFINGTGAGSQFIGIDTYAGSAPIGQTQTSTVTAVAFSPTTAALFCAELEMLLHLVRGTPDFVLMGDRTLRFWYRSCRALGYSPFEMLDPILGVPIPLLHGIPVYRNQFIPVSANTQSVYAGILGEGRGIVALYPSILPPPGIRIVPFGPYQVLDATSVRVSWDTSIAFSNAGCIARLAAVGLPTPELP